MSFSLCLPVFKVHLLLFALCGPPHHLGSINLPSHPHQLHHFTCTLHLTHTPSHSPPHPHSLTLSTSPTLSHTLHLTHTLSHSPPHPHSHTLHLTHPLSHSLPHHCYVTHIHNQPATFIACIHIIIIICCLY